MPENGRGFFRPAGRSAHRPGTHRSRCGGPNTNVTLRPHATHHAYSNTVRRGSYAADLSVRRRAACALDRITALECALTKNAPASSLECALTKSLDLKPFRIRTYKKKWGLPPYANLALDRRPPHSRTLCALRASAFHIFRALLGGPASRTIRRRHPALKVN